jgi:type I restriction enzyme R subunit
MRKSERNCLLICSCCNRKADKAVNALNKFMKSQGLECKPEEVSNLKGDTARAEFIDKFKEVQKLKTQLDQYTEIKEEQVEAIASFCRKTQ